MNFWLINRNFILVLLITSETLSGHFGFDSDTQAQVLGQQTDAQKRTATYFKILLWATAGLAVVRYLTP